MRQTDVSHLTDVPETMLWGLYSRAMEARRPDALLRDPDAIRIADSIAYDYARSFGAPDAGHVVRALATDRLLRHWLTRHPDGSVVALGEGLETQYYRVDNGRLHWLAVDLPEVIAIRRGVIPDTDRHRNLAGSALDAGWMAHLDPTRPVIITAVGLLKYFPPQDVRQIIATIAERLPQAEIIVDVMPRALIVLTHHGWYRKGRSYAVPTMAWGLNRDELSSMRAWHPNIADVREVPLVGGRTWSYRILLPLLRQIPWVRNHLFSLVHITCRNAGAATP
jgi:O-methyltransferase involved in polyketide biosynthesis